MKTSQDLYPCAYSQCDTLFQPTKHQLAAIRRGGSIYCTEKHGHLHRSERKKTERRANPKPKPKPKPPPPEPIAIPTLPGFVPYGAHANAVLSFPFPLG